MIQHFMPTVTLVTLMVHDVSILDISRLWEETVRQGYKDSGSDFSHHTSPEQLHPTRCKARPATDTR